jgi:Arc/MetJ family transcription regulator
MSVMPTEPVELDAELLAAARHATSAAGLRAFIERAVRRELDNEAFGKLLDEIEAESGPVPEEVLAEADRAWPDS